MSSQKWSFFILIGCPGRDRTCDILINSQMFYRWTTGQLWKFYFFWKFYFLWISLNHPLQVFIRKLVKCWNTLPVQFLHITDCHFFMIHLGRSKTFVTVFGNKFRITFFVICLSHIRHNKSLIRVMGLFPHCLGPSSHGSGANVKTKCIFFHDLFS